MCGGIEQFLACQPDRAFHQEQALQQQDDHAEDRGGCHRVAPDRIANVPGVEQQCQQQVGADGRVPHALPRVQPTLEFHRRELRQHRHGDGKVDAVGRADKEATGQDHLEAGGKHHQQCAGHGQDLGENQRSDAAPAVGHPAADRVEGNGHPGGKRGQQGDLCRRELKVARHRPEAGAQRRIGKCIKE
ncbi:hypothetical protein D3C72_1233860 [compost metagenome]